MKNNCSCGCGGSCSLDKITLKESKSIISEVLEHHISKNIPLHESKINHKSREYFDMWKEARYLYSKGLLDVGSVDKQILKETKIGEIVKYNGKQIPIDYPVLNEQKWGVFYDGVKYSHDFDSEEDAEEHVEFDSYEFSDETWEGEPYTCRFYYNNDVKGKSPTMNRDEIEIKPLNEYYIFKKEGNKITKQKLKEGDILNHIL